VEFRKHTGDLKRPRRFVEIIARAWKTGLAEALDLSRALKAKGLEAEPGNPEATRPTDRGKWSRAVESKNIRIESPSCNGLFGVNSMLCRRCPMSSFLILCRR